MSVNVQVAPNLPEYPYLLHSTVVVDIPAPKPVTVTKESGLQWDVPASKWTPLCHFRVDEVSKGIDDYFLQHWNFPDQKSRDTFVKAGFSRVTCLYFPVALDDRIHFACRLLTVLFLIDGKHGVL